MRHPNGLSLHKVIQQELPRGIAQMGSPDIGQVASYQDRASLAPGERCVPT